MTSPPAPEASLIERARRGDQAAYAALVRSHQDGLYRFIRRYVGDADEAYDLAQETFVSAWESLSRFDISRPAGPWLRRIALNKCRDWSRRRAVRRFFFGAVSLDASPDAAAAALPDAASDDAVLRRLDREIAALPPGLKEPLLLTTFEGLSHQDAGAALGLTAKAIENRVGRARKRLAERLGADASDGGDS
jgi:RNA polymerase sigma-70 factor (ECF subfamily)